MAAFWRLDSSPKAEEILFKQRTNGFGRQAWNSWCSKDRKGVSFLVTGR
jgi:hypothetical protein